LGHILFFFLGCPLLALQQIKKTKKSANKKPKKVAHSEGKDINKVSESEASLALHSSRLASSMPNQDSRKTNGSDEGEQPLNQDDMDGKNDVKEDKKRNNGKAGLKKEKKKSPGQKTEKQKEIKDDAKKGGNSAENSGKSSTQSSSREEKTDQLASSTMVSETSINKEEPAACGIKDPSVVSEDGKQLFLMRPNDIGGDSLDTSRAQNRLSCMGNTVFPNRGSTCNVPNTMQYHMKSHRASSGRYVEKTAQTDDVVIISLKVGIILFLFSQNLELKKKLTSSLDSYREDWKM
jgi:preprotein translocase subunit SecD